MTVGGGAAGTDTDSTIATHAISKWRGWDVRDEWLDENNVTGDRSTAMETELS